MAPIEEGTEITTHQHLLTFRPPPKYIDGTPMYPETCDGVMRAEPFDSGRGPVAIRCDVCDRLMSIKRRAPQAELVGAGAAPSSSWGF